MAWSDAPVHKLLTAELRNRVERVAAALKVHPDRVLNDLVQEGWVRFAARTGIKPEEW